MMEYVSVNLPSVGNKANQCQASLTPYTVNMQLDLDKWGSIEIQFAVQNYARIQENSPRWIRGRDETVALGDFF